ncbi:hypothetical protein FRX31_012162 [Thalictrum thalictroides]|uniref:Agenet domain-containing protein n=1 Tax=Thalictrum thalictroides TaxID=46969 RepID=A0A7J6WMR0_THATH|nr:hypothetical protein FRX31_012162 [Thalictrum thalictroides]
MEETQFSKGMEVEICSDDIGLRGAWFTATVLRSNPKRKLPLRRRGYQSNEREKIYVEYHTLLANEKGTKRLREYVDVINLRPIPPREVDRSFESSDEVDAYYNDGWWEGVVIRVLENCRYLVYFRSGKEEIEFGQSELRIHREWVKGSWMPPMEEEEKVEDEAGVLQVLTVEDKKADASQVSSMEDKAEEAKKLQGNQISLEDGSIQAFDTQTSAPDPGSSGNLEANDKAFISDSYNASVTKACIFSS